MIDSTDAVLETKQLCKEFNGFMAVQDASMQVRRGEIHALIGPNGAGKTTFFNLLTKFLSPTQGKIFYQGIDITHQDSATLARQGLVRSFQISAVFPHLNVRENIRLGMQRALGTSFHFWKSSKHLNQLDNKVDMLIDEVDLKHDADRKAIELPYGRKRVLELATTLAMDPVVMLLDEPTQGMGHEDVERVTQLIKKVASNRTVLMVEHNMKVVASIANTITVLQRGQIIGSGSYQQISQDQQVIEAYMGSPV